MFLGIKSGVPKCFWMCFLGLNLVLNAQIKTTGLNIHYGFIFAHSRDVENTRNSNPFGLQLDFAKQKTGQEVYNICNCYPRNGISTYYFNYDNKVLGHGAGIAYFLEPAFKLSSGLFFVFRGTLGLSYLSNPYHPTRNPSNNSYSLPVSALLGISGGFEYRLKRNYSLLLHTNYLHVSNGGVKDPNKGINWPTLSAGFNYFFKNEFIQNSAKTKGKAGLKNWRFDFFVLSSSRIAAVGDKQRYFVPGFGQTISRQLSTLSALTLGSDWHMDFALAEKQNRANQPRDLHFGAITTGHEFLLGRFLFTQQLGFYLVRPQRGFSFIYHRWGIDYRINRHLFAGINLKAHRQVAHFLDLRIGYSFAQPVAKQPDGK